jgi:nicotinate-nucleotide adenylyltransferase
MRRIGLLGGSFNPAHEGHRYISLVALKRLRLHRVWWMVSPQNPLKVASDLAPFEQRLAQAARVANHPRIEVTAIERKLRTTYTVDTLKVLTRVFRDIRFVWLIGADNLVQISSWEQWERIFAMVPIAVFARPSYSKKALASVAALRFAYARRAESRASELVRERPPVWVFLNIRPHPGSATTIRSLRTVSVAGKTRGECDRGSTNYKEAGDTRER